MPRATVAPKAKTTKKVKPKKKAHVVAPKTKTVIIQRRDSYSNVSFHADAPNDRVTNTNAKDVAREILAGRKGNSNPLVRTINHGSTCAGGVKSALGLNPKVGHIYRVKITYDVEDITGRVHQDGEKLAKDLQAVINKHTPKPKAKAKAKTVKKKVSKKKATSSRAKRRSLNRYVPPA